MHGTRDLHGYVHHKSIILLSNIVKILSLFRHLRRRTPYNGNAKKTVLNNPSLNSKIRQIQSLNYDLNEKFYDPTPRVNITLQLTRLEVPLAILILYVIRGISTGAQGL